MNNRNVVLDKLKVIAMIGIITIHMVYHCNLLENMESGTISYLLVESLYTIGFSMTNIFVLVSAHLFIEKYTSKKIYISNKKHTNVKKAFSLCAITSICSVSIYLAMIVFKVEKFSLFTLLECLFSVFVNQYWFIGAYIVLYLLAPYLTKMLQAISKNDLAIIIVIVLFVFSGLPTIMVFVPAQNLYDPSNGKGIIWFISLFVIIFYIKQYNINEKLTMKFKIVLLICNIIILIASRKILYVISCNIGLQGDGQGRLYFDSSLFVLAISLLIYLIAIDNKKKLNEIWTNISKCTLTVYLIHNQPILRTYLWDWCNENIVSEDFIIIYVLLIPIVIFGICFCIDISFKTIIKKCKVKNE